MSSNSTKRSLGLSAIYDGPRRSSTLTPDWDSVTMDIENVSRCESTEDRFYTPSDDVAALYTRNADHPSLAAIIDGPLSDNDMNLELPQPLSRLIPAYANVLSAQSGFNLLVCRWGKCDWAAHKDASGRRALVDHFLRVHGRDVDGRIELARKKGTAVCEWRGCDERYLHAGRVWSHLQVCHVTMPDDRIVGTT